MYELDKSRTGRMLEHGFESSYGVIVNSCCVKCGVWIALNDDGEYVNFEGWPHRCTKAQARGNSL